MNKTRFFFFLLCLLRFWRSWHPPDGPSAWRWRLSSLRWSWSSPSQWWWACRCMRSSRPWWRWMPFVLWWRTCFAIRPTGRRTLPVLGRYRRWTPLAAGELLCFGGGEWETLRFDCGDGDARRLGGGGEAVLLFGGGEGEYRLCIGGEYLRGEGERLRGGGDGDLERKEMFRCHTAMWVSFKWLHDHSWNS